MEITSLKHYVPSYGPAAECLHMCIMMVFATDSYLTIVGKSMPREVQEATMHNLPREV